MPTREPIGRTLSMAEDDALWTEPVVGSADVPAPYEDRGLLGVGGMGEVRRVYDPRLGRTAALKLLRAELSVDAGQRARFVAEAQVLAQLQHPGVVPVFERGELEDGRPWFVMTEISGRSLRDVLADGVDVRRSVELLRRVAETVAYAHTRGVVHRDLKPDNVMVGAFGEVLVLDWGLARVVGAGGDDALLSTVRSGGANTTRVGTVTGTPSYMAPEQAAGETERIGTPADAYALGAILYEALSGRPPYDGDDGAAIVQAVLTRDPEPLPAHLPPELATQAMAALARAPEARPTAASLADALAAWLDGVHRKDRARRVVEDGQAAFAAAEALSVQAARLRVEAGALLAAVDARAPEALKAPGWAREDEAEALERAAAERGVEARETVLTALTHAPDLIEAHVILADLALSDHRAAEAAGDVAASTRAAVVLRQHLDLLPPARTATHRAWLAGDGALSLETDPPGAVVRLYRYAQVGRRLVPMFQAELGRTPLHAVPLAMGRYLCRIDAPGRPTVHYPVRIGRQQHWDGVGPDGRRTVVPLPEVVPPGARYVPPGWVDVGTRDMPIEHELPARRVWVDGFFIDQFAVTNTEFIAFLDALVAEGREAEALLHVPSTMPVGGAPGTPLYGRNAAGGFVLQPDQDGDLWEPDWPVFMVDRAGARAYAAWRAARTGAPWSLPHEYAWEKAARGVDGRMYPWGDGFDSTYCWMRDSRADKAHPASVHAAPLDESPYGVRGMAGLALDWTETPFRKEGPPVSSTGALTADVAPTTLWAARGGAWHFRARGCAVTSRWMLPATNRRGDLSFRLVCPIVDAGNGGGAGELP